MSKPNTKEQLIYFLHNHVSLGTYDKKFIDNLVTNYVAALKPVTTNQSSLLDKVTLRYERQLRKEEIDANEMVSLKWNIEPIESSPKFTEAYIEIADRVIEVRTPFKTEFIKEFKNIATAVWHKDNKVWTVTANELNLKQVIHLVEKHYPKINYCDETLGILKAVSEYHADLYWNPTLVKSNGFMYIVAMNPSLWEAIKDIELSDSLDVLAKLHFHGVTISRSVVNDIGPEFTDDELAFILEREPTIEMNPEMIVSRLRLMGADYVLLRERQSANKSFCEILLRLLNDANIKVDILDNRDKFSILASTKQYKMPVLLGGYSFSPAMGVFFAKHIGIVNSKPIDIK